MSGSSDYSPKGVGGKPCRVGIKAGAGGSLRQASLPPRGD